MTASRTRGLTAIVLVVAALAALLPAGTSAAAPTTDTLWVARGTRIAACSDPSSPASLAGCFTGDPTEPGGTSATACGLTTDGVYVYSLTGCTADSDIGGWAWRCPIAEVGSAASSSMTRGAPRPPPGRCGGRLPGRCCEWEVGPADRPRCGRTGYRQDTMAMPAHSLLKRSPGPTEGIAARSRDPG